jgi:hypothetical protein
VRFSKVMVCLKGKPFDQVASVLRQELERHLPTLEAWDVAYLKQYGEKIQLGT